MLPLLRSGSASPLCMIILLQPWRSTANLQRVLVITCFYAGSERRQRFSVGSQAMFASTSAINEGEDNI
jgi:hypothetical protein